MLLHIATDVGFEMVNVCFTDSMFLIQTFVIECFCYQHFSVLERASRLSLCKESVLDSFYNFGVSLLCEECLTQYINNDYTANTMQPNISFFTRLSHCKIDDLLLMY